MSDLSEQVAPIDDPRKLLEDPELLATLIADEPSFQGRNIVDLRGVLVERLEQSLGKLEHTHRTVVSAAYENLAGTNQIHRAALKLIEAQDFPAFLAALADDVPTILGADGLHLCIEGAETALGEPLGPDGPMRTVIVGLPDSGVETYLGARATRRAKKVILRETDERARAIYVDADIPMASEAVLRVDLGTDMRPAMLVIGSAEPHRFHPDQATDLLEFLGGVLDATLRRWLVA